MKKFLLCLPLLLAACSQTPETRISNNPAIFLSLTPNQKEFVRAGQITKGMPKGGVFLAWGRPDETLRGQNSRGNTFEQWDYTSLRPVYTTGFNVGFGGGFGRWGGRYGSLGFGPDIAYVPYPTGSVFFENQKVAAWRQAR